METEEMADSLTGSFFVRAIRPAFADVNHLLTFPTEARV